MIRAVRRVVGVAAASCVALIAVPALVSGAGAVPATDSSAIVRGAHFSPDTPGVDVYLTAFSGGTPPLWLSSVGYGDVSPYQRLKPGFYAVSMRPHGASPSTPAALTWNLDAQAGRAYTAAAVGMNAQLHGIVLSDELTAPSNGAGRVRVIQAASRAPHAKVVAQKGPVVADDAAFASSTDYANVPAGTWPLVASSETSPSLNTTSTVTIKAGSVSSVVLLDAKGAGLTLRSVTDAAGAAVAPLGAVPGGGGSTAHRDNGLPLWTAGVLVAGTAGMLLGAASLRRNTRRPIAGRHAA